MNGGIGVYMDNGMDDWTGQVDADEEGDLRSRKDCTYASNRYPTLILDHGTAKKKVTGASTKARAKPRAPPPTAKPSISVYHPTVSVEREEDFLVNLLGGIDTAPLPAPVRSKKRKPSPVLDYDDIVPDRSSRSSSPVPYRNTQSAYLSDGAADDEPLSSPPSSEFEDFSSMMSPKKKARVTNGSSAVAPPVERMVKVGDS